MIDHLEAEGAARTWDLIRRAVLTHDALPEKTYTVLVVRYDIVREMADAYGYTDEKPPKFKPTPRDVSNMLPVWYWLTDLKRQTGTGSRDFKLLVARARGVRWWKLAQRWGKCEKTVQRWHDAAVCWVYLANREEIRRLV
jgi:hypothetical protein